MTAPELRSALGPRSLGALRIVAEAIFSSRMGPPASERLDWLCSEVNDFVWHAGGRVRWLIRLSLLALNILAPLTILRLPGLSRLQVKERARALARLEHTRAGAPVLAVKALLCMVYYEHPEVAQEVGYDAQCMKETA